jgi:hypothetical protein
MNRYRLYDFGIKFMVAGGLFVAWLGVLVLAR